MATHGKAVGFLGWNQDIDQYLLCGCGVILAFLGPDFSLFAGHRFGDGVRLDEAVGLIEQFEEFGEVFAEDDQAGFAQLADFFVAFAFGQEDEMIAVAGFLNLGGVGARADGFEESLMEDFGFRFVFVREDFPWARICIAAGMGAPG